jgi:signal transduction histidine kinase
MEDTTDGSSVSTGALDRGDQHSIVSNLSPGAAQKRLALAIVLGLLVVLVLVTGPLAGTKLGRVDAFVAVYAAAMFVTDSITSILLFAQFSILRTRAILVIAGGYLFTALIVVPYLMAFPGVFGPLGLIGGLQTTAWLYVSWHCGFPLSVLGYALLKDAEARRGHWEGRARNAIAGTVALAVVIAASVAWICIAEEKRLPGIMVDPFRFGPAWPYLVGLPIAASCVAALTALWLRRRSILDLWLMVVMCLYLVEIPLSYYPVPARFSVGWYTVRVIGFTSSIVILTLLLYEITTLYSRLLEVMEARRREREARLMTGDAVAAAIAHEIRQPLTAIIATADAGSRFLDRTLPDIDTAKQAFARIAADGHRAGDVVGSIRAVFKNDVKNRTRLDLTVLAQEVIDLARGDAQKHRVFIEAGARKGLPAVRGDRIQLQQVLLNLITNAIDAMAAAAEPRVLRLRCEAHESDGVLVSVADTGNGVEQQDIDRVFNPLFTTKPDGMGMGLSICRSIIEAHQGHLWAKKNEGPGMTFTFTLPAATV